MSTPTDDAPATPNVSRKRKMNFTTPPKFDFEQRAWLCYNGTFKDVNLFIKGLRIATLLPC